MTVEDPIQPTSLIITSTQTFYQAKIPCQHWQLRSLICSPSPDTVYYPTGSSIYALNTAHRKRQLIASLPFSPRCLGARYGWVCAGGVMNGHFASIRLGEPAEAHQDTVEELDSREAEFTHIPPGVLENKPEVKISTLGGLIVNSVTLHRPLDSRRDDDVFAVLTNNDKTVRIFSLARNLVVSTLQLNIATNHASISPNGKHLVIVGDSTKVYFYHPVRCSSETNGITEMGNDSWTPSPNTPLTAGIKESLISTSFSSSSLYCAVASQEGSITIFNTRYIQNRPSMAIVRQIESTRPRTYAGAIRSVQFSPEPWDLLVWAEHSGRVTIADARSGFVKRQTIDITIGDSDGIPPEEGENNAGTTILTEEAGNFLLSRRRPHSSREQEGALDDSTTSATIDQMASYLQTSPQTGHTLDTSRTSTVTRDWPIVSSTISNYSPIAAIIPYPHPPYPNYRSMTPNQVTRGGAAASAVSSTSAGPLYISPSTLPFLYDYRERQFDLDRWRQWGHEPPRRRNSVYLPHDITAPLAPIPPSLREPVSSHFSRVEREHDDQVVQPRSSETINQLQRNREHLSLLIAEERRRNLFRRSIHNLRRHDASSDADDDWIFLNSNQSENDGISITGCTLSFDGAKLYIATKKGIFEYRIDLTARRFFPNLKPR